MTEQFSEMERSQLTRVHKKKVRVEAEVVKKYLFSSGILDQWNNLGDETLNAENIKKLKHIMIGKRG